ncbi:hypothetical protein J6590_085340 [Homalodisca vitripennis]|nr:hypothetical protein J6590_085340 [Homalodisca vitripennis]
MSTIRQLCDNTLILNSSLIPLIRPLRIDVVCPPDNFVVSDLHVCVRSDSMSITYKLA